MTRFKLYFIAFGLLALSGCSDLGVTGVKDGNNGGLGQTCSLAGTWERCSSYGGSSTRVVLTATATTIFETIEEFNSVGDCSGTADNNFSFNATYTMGTLGASTSIAGGTDADLVPDVDLFGCGANQPAYTVIKFDTNCTEFNTTTTGPSCDSTTRGNAIDPDPFVKQ